MSASAAIGDSRAKGIRQPLHGHEWKFDGVPNEQLEACYLYEYAREFFKSSKHLQRFFKEWNAPKEKRNGKHLIALSKAWDLLETRCKNFPPIYFEYFPKTAWQDLPVLPKTEDRGFEINFRRDATERVNEWTDRHRKWHADRLRIETLRQCEPPNIRTIEAFRDYHEISNAISSHKQDLGNTEYGFFAINWDFKNSQIVEAFNHWLSGQREARKAIGLKEAKHPVSRGGFKDKLNWLGALRVKNHYRHKDLVGYAETKLKVVAPYLHYPDLLDAAKKATKEIEQLFPLQWSEKDFLRRRAERDRNIKKHPLVIPEAIRREDSKGVNFKS